MRNGKKTEADNANQQAIAQVDDRCCCVAGVTVESPRLAYAMPGMAANKVTAVHRLGRLPNPRSPRKPPLARRSFSGPRIDLVRAGNAVICPAAMAPGESDRWRIKAKNPGHCSARSRRGGRASFRAI